MGTSANFDPSGIGKKTAPAKIDANEPWLKDFDQRNFSELSEGYEGGKVAGGPSVPDKHQLRILKDTVANPLKGKFLGGPTAEEAEETLRKKFKFTDKQIENLKKAFIDPRIVLTKYPAGTKVRVDGKTKEVEASGTIGGPRNLVLYFTDGSELKLVGGNLPEIVAESTKRPLSWAEQMQQDHERKFKTADQALEARVIKLAAENKTLRPHLVPILTKTARARDLRVIQAAFPQVTKQKLASLTLFERQATLRRIAHKSIMLVDEGLPLTKDAVRAHNAFMVYKVDREKNNSKFYEGLIVPSSDGSGYTVKRRWGALTDSGQTGRIEGKQFDEDPRSQFPTEAMAQRELKAHYAKRVSHGYVDAYGPDHQTPDGHKLPMGEYPVGLTRKPGFGWGSQSVTQCIPALREVQMALEAAKAETDGEAKTALIQARLSQAVALLRQVAHADSTMAAKILGFFDKSLRRLSGSPRFLPDEDGQRLAAELFTATRYITKQLSLCDN